MSCLGTREDPGNLPWLASPSHDPECAVQQAAAVRVEAAWEAGQADVSIVIPLPQPFPWLPTI